jgi:hypothetical protein
MDSIKGAQILADLLSERGSPAAPVTASLQDETALPIFHWLGVEPASAAPARSFD